MISSGNDGKRFFIPILCNKILFFNVLLSIKLGFVYSLVFLIKILLSLVNLIVAPIGLTGKTPHSLGFPIVSYSFSVNSLVKLAVRVRGKLNLFFTFIVFKKALEQNIILLEIILKSFILASILLLIFLQESRNEFSKRVIFFGNTSIIDLTSLAGCNKIPPLVYIPVL